MGQKQGDKINRRNAAQKVVVGGTATQSCSTTSATTKLSADENKSPFSTAIGWVFIHTI